MVAVQMWSSPWNGDVRSGEAKGTAGALFIYRGRDGDGDGNTGKEQRYNLNTKEKGTGRRKEVCSCLPKFCLLSQLNQGCPIHDPSRIIY